MGLSPTKTGVTALCLGYFGFNHGPLGRNRTFVSRLSAEGSAIELQAGTAYTQIEQMTGLEPATTSVEAITISLRPAANRRRGT
jgi:hypothetical protein